MGELTPIPAPQHYAPAPCPAASGLALVESWHRRVAQARDILGIVVQEMDRFSSGAFRAGDYDTYNIECACNKIDSTLTMEGALEEAVKVLRKEMNRIQDGE